MAKSNRANVKEPLNKKRIIFLIVMALFLITGALLFNAPNEDSIIVVSFPSGARLKAEVADTPEKLLFGLAFRQHLPADEGIIYIFEESAPHKVWTKGFKIPVDIMWVNESKHVVHVVENVPPCTDDPCPWYGPPPENARYVIESNQGFIKQGGVFTGDELKFALRL